MNKKIDSINAARIKINDSIRKLNSQNKFRDFNGNHKFTYQTSDFPKISGNVEFKRIDDKRDTYTVTGAIISGENSVKINGSTSVVSDKHINFTGEIIQKIPKNGKSYTRSGKKTFLSKDGGKTWRLQDMVNDSGFIDYIDIIY